MTTNMRGMWSYRWWVAGFTIVAAVAAYVLSSRLPTSYTASASTQVISGAEQAGTFVDQNSLLQLTNYYLAQAQTTPVAAAAAQKLGHGTTAKAVQHQVSVSALPDSQELKFVGTSSDPSMAARFANAYANAFSAQVAAQQNTSRQGALAYLQDQISGVEAQLGAQPPPSAAVTNALTVQLQSLQTQATTVASRSADTINLIQDATPPTTPSSPKPKEDTALVLLLALLLGAAGAYGMAAFNDRYRSADEVARETGLVALAEIPSLDVSDPLSIEAFRSLRTTVEFVAHDMDRPIFVLTSGHPGAGKTHVASNLAGALAAGERRVMLVDGDLRRPTIHERLGLRREPGFSDLLLGRDPWSAPAKNGHVPNNGAGPASATNGSAASSANGTPAALGAAGRGQGVDQRAMPRGSLDVIPGGTPRGDAANLLASAATTRVMSALRRSYDLTLLDSPPMTVADPTLLARSADGVILVIDARRDRRTGIRQVIERLGSLELPIVGFVFNRADAKTLPYGYYPAAVATPDQSSEPNGPKVADAWLTAGRSLHRRERGTVPGTDGERTARRGGGWTSDRTRRGRNRSGT